MHAQARRLISSSIECIRGGLAVIQMDEDSLPLEFDLGVLFAGGEVEPAGQGPQDFSAEGAPNPAEGAPNPAEVVDIDGAAFELERFRYTARAQK